MAKFILIGAIIIGLAVLIWKFRDAIVGGLVAAFNWLIEKIQMVLGLLKKMTAFMSQGVLKYTPLGAMAFAANKALSLIPGGESTGAGAAQASSNTDFVTQTNNARVDINVNAPQSTRVIGESQGGFLNINRGMAGAF